MIILIPPRYRLVIIILIPVILIFISTHSIRPVFLDHIRLAIKPAKPTVEENAGAANTKVCPRYKNLTEDNPPPPIVDNFSLALKAKSATDLPPIPSWNIPPKHHVPEQTVLLIGFTRNWLLLQQTVVSYITAGWPPGDIIVIENTGTMDANERGRLTLQNPFYLDYHRLKTVYGVQIIRTPTLLSFAQLQNFFLSYAIDHSLGSFFWSHMDVIAISDELDQHAAIDNGFTTYQSLYLRAVETLRTHTSPNAEDKRWAAIFFAYDRLTLVNVKSYVDVGGWDTQIPFYGTDCDMHSRLSMAGWHTKELYTGLIYDIGHSLPDLGILYRPTVSNKATERGDSGYTDLLSTLDALQRVKNEQASGRNTWQGQQRGGHGEPFYRDPRGFEDAMRMTHDFGRSVFAEKWGHRDCDLEAAGLALDDQWKVTRDWESC